MYIYTRHTCHVYRTYTCMYVCHVMLCMLYRYLYLHECMYRRTVWYLYMVLHFSMFLYIEASRALLPTFSHHPSTAQFYRLPKCRCGIRSIVPLATQISIVVSSLVIQTTTGRIIILTIVFWRWHHHCGRWWWCSW